MSIKTELEKNILGSILLDNAGLSTAVRMLQPSDFSEGFHRHVFEAMLVLRQRDYSIDPVTVLEEMHRQKTYSPTCQAVTQLTYNIPPGERIEALTHDLLVVNRKQVGEPEWPEFIGQ